MAAAASIAPVTTRSCVGSIGRRPESRASATAASTASRRVRTWRAALNSSTDFWTVDREGLTMPPADKNAAVLPRRLGNDWVHCTDR